MKTRDVLFFQYPWRFSRDRLAGVCRYARNVGWQVSVAEYGRNFDRVPNALRFWRPDGVIVEGGYTERADFRQSDFKGCPTVFCDARASRMRKEYSGVVCDSREVVALAARELLSLGRSSYAFVGNFQPREWSDQRRECFVKAVEAEGKVCNTFEPGEAGDFRTFRERLGSWLASLPHPCGLLAANDSTAGLVLYMLKNMHVKVPEDIAVVGIDNDPLVCENTTPALTSLALDFEGSGYLAAEMLDARMNGRAARDEVRVFGAVHVVHRESTLFSKRRDDIVKKAMEFIREKISDGVSPRDVVRLIGGSRRQAEHRFKAFVGTSIGEKIKAARLEAAKELLADPSVPIGLVAFRCGYANDSSLRKVFKAAAGLSLSAYRKAMAQRFARQSVRAD